MFKLAAVFSPGFEKVIPKALKDVLPDAYNLNISSGFLRFCTDKNPFRAVNADFLNNSFLVLKEWNGDNKNAKGGNKAPAFEVMANKIRIPDQLIPEIAKQHYKTFRLRFSQANVFTSVNKNVMANVEKQISQATGMKPDRLGGDTEFWFLTRTDGYACFALRMTKKQSTEKYLEKGELRPEFVTLLAAFAETATAPSGAGNASCTNAGGAPSGAGNASCANAGSAPAGAGNASCTNAGGAPAGDTNASQGNTNASPGGAERTIILDPFAGHGGIVKRLAQMYPKAEIIASELDGELAKKLKGCRQADATNLDFIKDNSVDCVITDPPWGFWQGDLRDDKKLRALYDGMLKELFRVTKPGASLCILTAAKEVFEAAFDASDFARARDALIAHNTSAAHNASAANNAVSSANDTVSEGTTTYNATDIRNDVLVNGKKSAVYVWRK